MRLGKIEKKCMLGKKHAMRGIEHVERLLPYTTINKNQSYLEVGCGNGHVCKHIASKYQLNVTGTDVDPEMIRFAKENSDDIKNCRFVVADATAMPFESHTFDIILSFGVIHHISDWEKALDEMSRLLKPQGFLIFGDFAYSEGMARILKRIINKYGIYTIDDVIHRLKSKKYQPLHREKPTGTILKYYSIVFQKMG
jgi:ubiquinone/menaquinone biosynthesis C-methylase UbiE